MCTCFKKRRCDEPLKDGRKPNFSMKVFSSKRPVSSHEQPMVLNLVSGLTKNINT